MARRITFPWTRPAICGFGGLVLLGCGVFLAANAAVTAAGAQAKSQPDPAVIPKGMQPDQIFRTHCLACHNVDGKGGIVRPGMPDIPDFTVQAWHKTKNDADLTKSILAGGKIMPPMKDKLSPEDASKMVLFIRGFKDGMVVKLDASSPTDKNSAATALFRAYCTVCHGEDGSGKTMRANLPPLPDFTNAGWQKQQNDPQLAVSILEGKGTLMPANRGRVSEDQARALVGLVRGYGPAGAAAAPTNSLQQQLDDLQRQMDELKKKSGK